MIEIKINEIAGAMRHGEVGGGENREKANKMASFQFSVSSSSAEPMEDRSVQPATEELICKPGDGSRRAVQDDCSFAYLERAEKRQRTAAVQNLAGILRSIEMICRLGWLALLRLVLRTQPRSRGGNEENIEHRTSNAERRMKDGKAPLPGPPPTTASRGEGGDCAQGCIGFSEDALAAWLADVAAAGSATTAALRRGKEENIEHRTSNAEHRNERWRGKSGLLMSAVTGRGRGGNRWKIPKIPRRKVVKVGRSYIKLLKVGCQEFF